MDYNDFYMKSIASGAQPDSFGNVTHTAASMQTMAMNEANEQFFNASTQRANNVRTNVPGGFWDWVFSEN